MEIISVELTANERTVFHMPGRFFMLVEAGAPLDVSFEKNRGTSSEVARAVEAGFVREPGDWSNPDDGAFDGVVLESSTNQNARFGISKFSADYRRVVGIVQVETANGGATATDQAVGVASSVIAAVNASRRAVHVQNTHANAVIRVGPGVVTSTRGVRLVAGQSVTFHTTAAINAIREGAADGSVGVTEETRV